MPYADPERQRASQRNRVARIRASYMAGQCCAKCGSTENLELDHIDPSTKVDHKIWTWTKARRDNEYAKCQWLCKSCHVDKTLAENGLKRAEHGSVRKYRLGCRCTGCRRAKRASR